MMKSIAVFCGSSAGVHPKYGELATAFGSMMGKREITLVYGGASIGLMGCVADAVLALNGKVYGVIPGFLSNMEIAHPNLTELFTVDTMHERKAKMAELSDAFVALPGGFGTLEELFEMLTWSQLSLHDKPIVILNQDGFYNGILEQCRFMMDQGFLKPKNMDLIRIANSPEEAFALVEQ